MFYFSFWLASMKSILEYVCMHMYMLPTQCVYPLELSVGDKQLILTAAAAGMRRLKDLVAGLFRQLLPLYVYIWQQRQHRSPT